MTHNIFEAEERFHPAQDLTANMAASLENGTVKNKSFDQILLLHEKCSVFFVVLLWCLSDDKCECNIHIRLFCSITCRDRTWPNDHLSTVSQSERTSLGVPALTCEQE